MIWEVNKIKKSVRKIRKKAFQSTNLFVFQAFCCFSINYFKIYNSCRLGLCVFPLELSIIFFLLFLLMSNGKFFHLQIDLYVLLICACDLFDDVLANIILEEVG